MSGGNIQRVVVCGAGTGVGKTYVACSLLRMVRGARRGLKPVESGVVAEAVDAVALARAADHAVVPPLYAFRESLSPHLCARRGGVVISVKRATRWVAEHAAAGRVVVETAGGLLSPLSEDARNADLVRALAPGHVLVVAANRLGVLHDVEACLRVLERDGLRGRAVVVVTDVGTDGSSTSNVQELQRLSPDVPVFRCWVGEDVPVPLLARLGWSDTP